MAGKTALSDWELRELEHYARCGWTAQELGWHYGLNERSVQRLLRRLGVDERVKEGGPLMASNTLGRMTDMLFEELERLNGLDVTDAEALSAEVERSKAMQGMAKEINQSAKSQLEAAQFRAEWAGARQAAVPKVLGTGE